MDVERGEVRGAARRATHAAHVRARATHARAGVRQAEAGPYPNPALPPRRYAAREGRQLGEAVPVTIEGPDGDRHAIEVDLRGIASTAELRQGMLQGYRELLDVPVAAAAICVQARLASGASQLLADATPLTDQLLGAVSFYVWAELEPADLYGVDEPGPGEGASEAGAPAGPGPPLGIATLAAFGADRELLSAAAGQ